MLRKTRIILSAILFTAITLFFLDFAGFLPSQFHALAHIQFIPALLALNIVIIAALVIITAMFGRIYCSAICPMGIYQDIVAWLSKRFVRKKKYTFSRAKTVLRWSVLAVTIVAYVFGFTFLLGLLDPYGAYGRMATHLLRPAYLAGNNLLADIFTSFGHHTFYRVGIYSLGIFSTLIALITLLAIGFLAWKNGRTYCNTLCPVGTMLGFVARQSLMAVRIDEEKCNSCGLCAMKCKASCIEADNKQIDQSRCVSCFNCINVCKRDAMKYSFANPLRRKQAPAPQTTKDGEDIISETGQSRRRFLSATLATSMIAGKAMADKMQEAFSDRKPIKRQTPIAPPGALNFDHLLGKCISCHLCVSKCPSHVIKPAFLEYGAGGMMQPKLYFDHGFCNYDCTICSEVCPTHAIVPLTKEEKHHTQMGRVEFVIENCIVYYDETSCGACSEHCPTQAVSMVPYKDGALTIPHIEPEICVGCGGCEYVCPAIPFKAIYVEGVKTHNIIELDLGEQKDVQIDDFGF